jgi:hypothetical protein
MPWQAKSQRVTERVRMRDTGFEPVTPTFGKCYSKMLQFPKRAKSAAPTSANQPENFGRGWRSAR